MERVETKIVKSTETYHTFYCDICGEEICTLKESSDGYCDNPTFSLSFYNAHPRLVYNFDKHLCERCKMDFKNKLKVELTKLGFEAG